MNTRRRSSQSSSQTTSSNSEISPSPIIVKDSATAALERSPPHPVAPEQTEIALPTTTSPITATTKDSSAQRKIGGSARLVTPEPRCATSPPGSSPGSSPLSSLPSSLGTTPEGLTEPTTRTKRKATSPSRTGGKRVPREITTLTGVPYGSLSPEQRTELKRKAGGIDIYFEEDDVLAVHASKRAKISAPKKSALNTRSARPRADPRKRNRNVRFADSISSGPKKSTFTPLADTALADVQGLAWRPSAEETEAATENLTSSQDSNEQPAPKGRPGRKPRQKRKTKDQLALEVDVRRHAEWVAANVFPHENEKNPIFYGADGITQYAELAEGSPAKNGKPGANTGGGVKKKKGGGGWNKGLGKGKGKGKGRGRGRGNRRDDEEEDLFEGKDSSTEDQKNLVKILKARQALLRNFFRDVGRQQVDILDTLSLRDINRLLRRANAHKKVPEYDDVLEDLQEKKQDAIDLANRRFELEKKLAEDQFAQKQELLAQQLKQRCKQVRAEHLSGAQGDLMLLQKQAAAIIDDDRTDDGSHNEDPEYFPRYHEFPESNVRSEPVRVRGYTSNKVVDERPFKHQLAASNYDDQVRRDVLQSDVMAPIVRSLEISNKERREAEARQKTQNMMALSNEAVHQLSDIKGYLVPTPMSSTELNSYSLSLLADISEYHADKFKDKTYRYLALAPGETFPREALEYEQLPGAGAPPRRQHPPPPRFPTIPNPRTHQFVFQNPGVPPTPRSAPTAQSPQATPTPRVQQRFPVQFVNQTIESRKAAGNQGKGGQRMLLPKV